MKQILSSIISNAKDFPALPSATLRVLQLTNDENTTYKHLAKIISTDVSLATGILKTANSPYYGTTNEITNIEQALSILGFKRIKNITMSLSVINMFPKEHLKYYSELFNVSLASSVAAEMISKCFSFEKKPEIFLTSLLSKIGMFVLLRYLTDQYMNVIKQAQKRGLELEIVEEAIIGSTHIEVGEMVGQKWNLPENIMQTIRFHRNIIDAENNTTLAPDNLSVIKTIYLSWIAADIFTGWNRAYKIHLFKREFARLTGREEKTAIKLLTELPDAFSKFSEIYNLRSGYLPSFDKVRVQAVDETIENQHKYEQTYSELNYVHSILHKKTQSLQQVNSELHISKSVMENLLNKLHEKHQTDAENH